MATSHCFARCWSWLYVAPVPVVKLSCCGWGRGTPVGQDSRWRSWPPAAWAPPRKWRGRCPGGWCQRFFLHTSSHPPVESTWSFHPVGRNSNVVLILICFIIPKKITFFSSWCSWPKIIGSQPISNYPNPKLWAGIVFFSSEKEKIAALLGLTWSVCRLSYGHNFKTLLAKGS